MPGVAPVDVPALTLDGSEELALVRANELGSKSGLALSCNEDTSDCTWPNADRLVCRVVALVCNACSGRLSTAISEVTIALTSSPLPIPAEERVPVDEVMVVMSGVVVSGRVVARFSLCYRQLAGKLERGAAENAAAAAA